MYIYIYNVYIYIYIIIYKYIHNWSVLVKLVLLTEPTDNDCSLKDLLCYFLFCFEYSYFFLLTKFTFLAISILFGYF